MKAAFIGLNQSGKSTILAALCGKELQTSVNMSIEEVVVAVPDDRIEWLSGIYNPKKKNYATINCLDLPGISFTDDSTRASARKLLAQVKTVDMLVLVIRAFENDSVAAYKGSIDTKRDLSELKTEILLNDLEMVANRIDRLGIEVKKPSKRQALDKAELELMMKLQDALENEKPISTVVKDKAEMDLIKSFGFLTLKPMVAVFNIDENNIDDFSPPQSDIPSFEMCAKIEYELSLLDEQSRVEFKRDLGITESASAKFVQSCYDAMGMISFLTVGSDECRAWQITKGTTALDAAGKIHSDIKRGFIRAETFSFDDIKQLGDEKAVKAAGKMRLEGKTYIVQDGDIINFRFNV